MLKPIDPDVLSSWIAYNERFKTLIYPTIFQPFGIAFNTAYSVWSASMLKEQDNDEDDWKNDSPQA